MRRFSVLMMSLALGWGLSVSAAGKSPTTDDLDKLMRKVGSAQQAMQKAIAAGNAADAKAQLMIVKTSVRDAQGFWVATHRDDAVAMGKAVLDKLDGLEKLVAGPTIDTSAANAAVRDLGTACNACHRVYRTTDEENGFILKPGTVPGY